MDERNDNPGQQQSSGNMGTSENSNDLQNPINTGGKSENSNNDSAVAATRTPTERSTGLSTKTNTTGSDFDGQVSS